MDPSGGSSDSFTLAIAHLAGEHVIVDAIREQGPPFDPDQVIADYASLLLSYGVSSVTGDRWGGVWPARKCQKCGIGYHVAELAKSDLYKALLPRLNAGTIALPDQPKLGKQLVALERKTAWGGRESIDHPPNGHDDVANAVAGVSSLFARAPRVLVGCARLPEWA